MVRADDATPAAIPRSGPSAALLAPDILALLEESPATIAAETEELHPADLADVAERCRASAVPTFLAALPGRARGADVLEYLDEELRAEVLEAMTARQAAELVTRDDAGRSRRRRSRSSTRSTPRRSSTRSRPRRAARREQLLAYDPDTAGGLMTTEFVSVSADTTVEEALGKVRAIARSGQREAMYAIYTTDDEGRLAGVLSLRELLAAPAGAKHRRHRVDGGRRACRPTPTARRWRASSRTTTSSPCRW